MVDQSGESILIIHSEVTVRALELEIRGYIEEDEPASFWIVELEEIIVESINKIDHGNLTWSLLFACTDGTRYEFVANRGIINAFRTLLCLQIGDIVIGNMLNGAD